MFDCDFQDGVYIKGMYLQGAGWDKKNACLVEAEPMQLVCPIPTIHFKPVESKRRSQRGMYSYTLNFVLFFPDKILLLRISVIAIFGAWQINRINDTNRINYGSIDLCKLGDPSINTDQ